jgi:hypothetical protein
MKFSISLLLAGILLPFGASGDQGVGGSNGKCNCPDGAHRVTRNTDGSDFGICVNDVSGSAMACTNGAGSPPSTRSSVGQCSSTTAAMFGKCGLDRDQSAEALGEEYAEGAALIANGHAILARGRDTNNEYLQHLGHANMEYGSALMAEASAGLAALNISLPSNVPSQVNDVVFPLHFRIHMADYDECMAKLPATKAIVAKMVPGDSLTGTEDDQVVCRRHFPIGAPADPKVLDFWIKLLTDDETDCVNKFTALVSFDESINASGANRVMVGGENDPSRICHDVYDILHPASLAAPPATASTTSVGGTHSSSLGEVHGSEVQIRVRDGSNPPPRR